MLRTILFALVSMTTLAAAQPGAEPTAPTPAPATATNKMFGVGYKAGNGIGFLGADILVAPVPHFALDVQGAFMPVSISGPNVNDSANIYAVAPAVQYSLWDGQRSTPYVSVGMVYAHLALGGATASVLGEFANLGYEWRWQSGLGIQLGGGVGYIAHGEASNGTNMVTIGGKVNPNIELGLRYMFF
jgi:hypothetical protein